MDAETAYNDLLDKYAKLDLFPVASFQALKSDALKIAWEILIFNLFSSFQLDFSLVVNKSQPFSFARIISFSYQFI